MHTYGNVDMDEDKIKDTVEIDQIYRFMTAYPFDLVKDGFLILYRERLQLKKEQTERQLERIRSLGWEELEEGREIPSEYEWNKLGSKIFIRSPAATRAANQLMAQEFELRKQSKADQKAAVKKKTDLSMQQTDKICITCGGTLAYEPICAGCRLGRLGFKGRYVCMEDMDHEFYVLKDGIILPNQGD